METLNSLEKAILEEIFQENGFLISEHFPQLRVKSREYSGVGVFTHFNYSKEPNNLIENKEPLSTNKLIKLDKREADIQDVLFFEGGLISMLELVTWNDSWDGKYETFDILEHES